MRGIFQKFIAPCPTVYKDPPLSPVKTVRESLHRTGADPKAILGMLWFAQDYARDDAEWKSLSPIALESVDPATAPKFQVSGGLYDKYGNFEGADYLGKRARERGIEVDWHPLYGGHCAIDVASVADFLARAQ